MLLFWFFRLKLYKKLQKLLNIQINVFGFIQSTTDISGFTRLYIFDIE